MSRRGELYATLARAAAEQAAAAAALAAAWGELAQLEGGAVEDAARVAPKPPASRRRARPARVVPSIAPPLTEIDHARARAIARKLRIHQ